MTTENVKHLRGWGPSVGSRHDTACSELVEERDIVARLVDVTCLRCRAAVDALPGETDDERHVRILNRVQMATTETYPCGHKIACYPDLAPELMERERAFHLEGRCMKKRWRCVECGTEMENVYTPCCRKGYPPARELVTPLKLSDLHGERELSPESADAVAAIEHTVKGLFAQRAEEKATSRAADEAALKSGEKTPEQLRDENAHFARLKVTHIRDRQRRVCLHLKPWDFASQTEVLTEGEISRPGRRFWVFSCRACGLEVERRPVREGEGPWDTEAALALTAEAAKLMAERIHFEGLERKFGEVAEMLTASGSVLTPELLEKYLPKRSEGRWTTEEVLGALENLRKKVQTCAHSKPWFLGYERERETIEEAGMKRPGKGVWVFACNGCGAELGRVPMKEPDGPWLVDGVEAMTEGAAKMKAEDPNHELECRREELEVYESTCRWAGHCVDGQFEKRGDFGRLLGMGQELLGYTPEDIAEQFATSPEMVRKWLGGEEPHAALRKVVFEWLSDKAETTFRRLPKVVSRFVPKAPGP